MMYQECAQNPSINNIVVSVGNGSLPVLRRDYTVSVIPVPSDDSTDLVSRAAPKRGRPPKPTYPCPHCGRVTRLTQSYCCQWCRKPRTPAGLSSDALQSWWVSWVASHQWTHFGTATFPWALDGRNLRACLAMENYERRFFERVRSIYPRVAWFAVPERDRSGQLHLHWVSNTPTLTASFLQCLWRRKYEGFAKVGLHHLGASIYTCKTLARSDLHSVGGHWQKLLPASAQ
jgi:hypothetical protein